MYMEKLLGMLNRPFWAVLGCLSVISPHVQSSDIEFAGFASFVYAKGLDDKGLIEGIINEGEYRDYNKLGLRLDADLDDDLSFAVQMIADGSNDYDPDFEWIYASYTLPFYRNVTISVGKTRTPLFMYSDYEDIGYAYHWVEPPRAVYNAGNVKSTEGLRINYLTGFGDSDWSSDLTVWAGKSEDKLQELGGATLEVEDSYGLAWSVNNDWLTVRAVYFTGDTTMDLLNDPDIYPEISAGVAQLTGGLSQLADGVNAFGGTLDLSEVVDNILWEKDEGEFIGFGTMMDFNSVFVGAELTNITVDHTLSASELDSFYVTFGGRLPGQVTLSLTYSEDDDAADDDTIDLYWEQVAPYFGAQGALGGAVDGDIEALGAALKDVLYTQQRWETEKGIFSARWDFHSSAALKFEHIFYSKLVIAEADERKPKAVRISLDLVF